MENGVVQWQNRGLALMACIERYGKGGQIALAVYDWGNSEKRRGCVLLGRMIITI